MTREEYNELRARAHEQMLDDYKWMLDQESGIREWRCPKRWIIEFVHDVSDYVMVRSSGEEDVGDEWHDDLLRPIPLQKLYRQFFQKSCIPPPNHPDKALSKLRGHGAAQQHLPRQHHEILHGAAAEESSLPNHRAADHGRRRKLKRASIGLE